MINIYRKRGFSVVEVGKEIKKWLGNTGPSAMILLIKNKIMEAGNQYALVCSSSLNASTSFILAEYQWLCHSFMKLRTLLNSISNSVLLSVQTAMQCPEK